MSKLPAIYVVSDLHIDTGPFEWPEAALSADLIIVAGDLANGIFDIEFLKQPNKPVVFVPGNHDMWSARASRDMFDIYAEMKRVAEGTQVHVLWDEEFECDGIRIIGTPLWTDFGGGNEELMNASFMHSRDYDYINAKSWYANPDNLKLHQEKGGRFKRHNKPDAAETGAFTPLVAYSLHQKSLSFIQSRLDEDYEGLTILVTHMAPSYDCLRKSGTVRDHYLDKNNWECRGRDNTSLARVAGYASDLSKLFDRYRKRLDLAVHGHIHDSLDIVCGSTRVVANPRGRYSGPLTEESSQSLALFGYPVSKKHIEESQAVFAAYPYWGDNRGFEPQKLVRLEDGLAPAIRPAVDDALPRLLELHAEMLELQPFVAHRTKALRRSIHESVITRAKKFTDILNEVLLPAQDAFDASEFGNAEWWSTLLRLGLPIPKSALQPRFTSPLGEKREPSTAMAGALEAMGHLLKTLPLVPDVAELARKKYRPLVAEAVQLVAARGFTPILKETPPVNHWRKLYFDLGTVHVDGSEEEVAELNGVVDKHINGGTVPRYAYLSVHAPYRPRPAGSPETDVTPRGSW
jgi:Icc-related predicted phosphoesterase